MTPYSVHSGQAEAILQQRKQVLLFAFECHPERFKGKQPDVLQLPEAAWINPPADSNPQDDTLLPDEDRAVLH